MFSYTTKYDQVFFCSSMAEVSTVLYSEIHRRLGYYAKIHSKALKLKWGGVYKKLVNIMKATASYLDRLTKEIECCIEALSLISDRVSDSVSRVPFALEKRLPNILDVMKNKVTLFLPDGAVNLNNSIVQVLCLSALTIEGHHIRADLGIDDDDFPQR